MYVWVTHLGALLTTVNATDSETGVSHAITGGNGLETFPFNLSNEVYK